MSRRDEIKADEKVRIAKAYTQGKIGISEAAKQIGVHHTVIKDWIQMYQTEGTTALAAQWTACTTMNVNM